MVLSLPVLFLLSSIYKDNFLCRAVIGKLVDQRGVRGDANPEYRQVEQDDPGDEIMGNLGVKSIYFRFILLLKLFVHGQLFCELTNIQSGIGIAF